MKDVWRRLPKRELVLGRINIIESLQLPHISWHPHKYRKAALTPAWEQTSKYSKCSWLRHQSRIRTWKHKQSFTCPWTVFGSSHKVRFWDWFVLFVSVLSRNWNKRCNSQLQFSEIYQESSKNFLLWGNQTLEPLLPSGMCNSPGRPVLSRCLSAFPAAANQSRAQQGSAKPSFVSGPRSQTTHLCLPHCSWTTSDSDAGRCTACSKSNPFFWYPNSLVSSHFLLVIVSIAKNPSWRTPTVIECSTEPVRFQDSQEENLLSSLHMASCSSWDLLLYDMVNAEVNPWGTGLYNA